MDTAAGMFLVYLLFAILYLAALGLAVSNWRRSPTACGLMIGAALILLIVTFIRAYLQYMMLAGNMMLASPAFVFTMLGIVQWVGQVLLVVAVLANRNQSSRHHDRRYRAYLDDEDWDDPTEPRTK